ncbi:uncharacterized protein [Penaeus vannamei]|uniref:uncharacterized protein n=1 Tax=Penaeus vannamei TaxID=6689 RepID=UPI00387F50C6
MRSAYPLLVEQNGWSVGSCRNPTSILRSVGVDLSRPSQYQAPHAHHDIEIHVEDPPSSFSHEYPQPLANAHLGRAKGGVATEPRSKRKPVSDVHRTGSFNRAVQRLELSVSPDADLRVDPRPHLNAASRSSAGGTATPRASPRSSPRASSYGRRVEGANTCGGGVVLQQDHLESNHRDYSSAGSNGTGRCTLSGPSFALPVMSRPSQLSLCCSSPDYYYNEERLRQEPEPGLLNCCDKKVSCCPCCPCLEPYCPVGHMNTVCMSMICSFIILFIILSPLLHYLVPS